MESPSGAVAIDFCKVAFLYNRDVGIIEWWKKVHNAVHGK